MKQTFLILFLLAALPLQAETPLFGRIDDLTIDETNNPVVVTENIIVQSGKTLTIGAGTVFLFKPFTGIVIEGRLIVEGTLQKPVVFTSENDTVYNPSSRQPANPFDWNGILITPKAGLVKLSNFKLEYSVYGIKSQKEEFIISNGTFMNNGQFHVTVNDAIKNVVENTPFNFGTELLIDRKPTREKKPGTSLSLPKPAAMSLGGVGIAAIGLGGYFYFLGSSYDAKLDTVKGAALFKDYEKKRNSAFTTANACTIGGVAFLAAGLWLYPWKSQTGAAKKVSVAPILGTHNGVVVTVNY